MRLIIVTTLLVTFVSYIEARKDVVCYIPTWGPDITNKVDTRHCSVFVIAFGTLDASGNVGVPANFADFKKLKTSNSKLILALGGASAGTSIFKQNAATTASRATFAQNCLNLVKNNGLDGIDIDWEFPDSSDRGTFVALHSDLKAKLGGNYIVSTAVSVGQWLVSTNKVYDIANLAKSVDHINLMSYDMHMDEPWDSSFGVYFNSPIKANSGDSVDQGINLFLQGGAPASKLIVGVPFYGRQYQLADASKTSPGSPFIGGHQASGDSYTPPYNSYCPKLADASWTKQRDRTAVAPYMFRGNVWISYEDQQSVTDKANLANTYNLGGVMLWSLNQDDYDGVCSSCKWPLLKSLNVAVGRVSSSSACGSSSGNGNTIQPAVVTTTTKPSSGNKGTSLITICATTGSFAHPSDCTQYLSCTFAGEAPYVMSCGSGLKWNNQAKYCDWNCVP